MHWTPPPVWLPWLLLAHLTCVMGVQQLTNPRIVEHPQDQYVAKNEPATLNCKAEGIPPPQIVWYRDGRPIITANEDSSSHRMLLPSGQLFFLRIIHNKSQKPDVGTYYCKATNPETRTSVVSRNATLEIAVLRDVFGAEPKDTIVAVGEQAVLHCTPPRGVPEPRVKWKKNGHNLHTSSRIRVRDGNLILRSTVRTDTGTYTCIGHNIAGERESKPVRLSVLEKPKILQSPLDVLVDENQDVKFQCQASGDPQPAIVWKREEEQMPPDRSEILGDKSLQIRRVKVSDEGVYICRAENTVGSVEAIARLSVHSQPSFVLTPRDKVVGIGRKASFRCEVTGSPPPAVFWNKGLSQVLMFPRQDHGRFAVTDEGTLEIDPVRKEDAGEYICQALNVAGSAFARARLQVKDVDPRPPPIIHQGPQNQTLPVNSVAMLQCSASGDPQPSIRWYKDQRPVTLNDLKNTLLDSGTLQISDLQKSDTGMYTCKASSETGDTAWSAALIVEAPTDPSVIFHRTPEPSTFPGPPSKPSVTEITETSMKLMWKANTNHGASPVQSYTIEYFSHETGEGWVVGTESVIQQHFVVRNLQPNTSYMFLVRSKNSHGLSLPSQVAGPVKTLGRTKVRPKPPQFDPDIVREKLSGKIVHLKDPEVVSATAVRLTWQVNNKSQRYIEGYHIKYRVWREGGKSRRQRDSIAERSADDFNIETLSRGSATVYMLRNLNKFTWYEIQVQPFYQTIEGHASNIVKVRTYEDLPSESPQHIKWDFKDNTTLDLTWKPPPPAHHNGPLRGYKIYLYGNESKFNREFTTNASVHNLTIPHLVAGLTYRLQMCAYNRMGEGKKTDHIKLGDGNENGLYEGFIKEPWFIGLLIGGVGSTLWIGLCLFSIWLYRKKRARKKLDKNESLHDSNHRNEETARLGYKISALNAPNYMQKDIQNHVNSLNPVPPSDIARQKEEEASRDNTHQGAPLNIEPSADNSDTNSNVPVQPYATSAVVMGNHMIVRQPMTGTLPNMNNNVHSNPVGSYAGRQGNGEMMYDNQCPQESCQSCRCAECDAAQELAQRCDPRIQGGENERNKNQFAPNQQPLLFLPPPPEHPPPSDIGTPPDSPTQGRCNYGRAANLPHIHPYSRIPNNNIYYDIDQRSQASSRDQNPYDIERRSLSSSQGRAGYDLDPRTQAPSHPRQPYASQTEHRRSRVGDLPGYRSESPTYQCGLLASRGHDVRHPGIRTYSPRAMSDTERGPTPPVRGNHIGRGSDDSHRHHSDTEGGSIPARRTTLPQHDKVQPGRCDDAVMDRAIQSSLPSLASECINNANPRMRSCANSYGHGHPSCHGRYPHQRDSCPISDLGDITDCDCESDLEATRRHHCGITDPNLCRNDANRGAWAEDNTDVNCYSGRSSLGSSSDGSFFDAEADFANAVARAAELSGLTLANPAVTSPLAGRARDRGKRFAKPHDRAKATSPPYYSPEQECNGIQDWVDRLGEVDDNEQSMRDTAPDVTSQETDEAASKKPKPPIKAKPQLPLFDLPAYNKPTFPIPSTRGAANNVPTSNASNSNPASRDNTPRSPSNPTFLTSQSPGGMTSQQPRLTTIQTPTDPTLQSSPKTAPQATPTSQSPTIRSNPLEAFDTTDTPIV